MSDGTLQPYDGANKVRFPNGTECWEKETEHFGGSETSLSYQYSVQIPDTVGRDYWGRVLGVKIQAEDGSWNEAVNFMPVTKKAEEVVRLAIEKGWSTHRKQADNGSFYLDQDGFLETFGSVMNVVEQFRMSSPRSPKK